MLKRTLLALALVAAAWAAQAADDVAATAATVEADATADDAPDAAPVADTAPKLPAPTHPVFRGRVGEAPVQVVFNFLGDHASNEVGQFDYQKLSFNQTATDKDRQQVNLDVTMLGTLESARAAQRFQFKLVYADKIWFITAARQDWKCRSASNSWTQRPCK